MDYTALKSNSLFIETGSFENYGGWVLDTQFIVNMGSAYLLAHGIGVPVQDAVTHVSFPARGSYRLWAFTKDWVAPWKQDMAPGLFQVAVNEQTCACVFGNQSAEWSWQDGGVVTIDRCDAQITLKDLTGFEGRCAALFFTQQLDFVPPSDQTALSVFRRVLCNHEDCRDFGTYDLVVAGGGIAGMCTAVSAARQGLKVALVQDRDVVGGNNSSEVRVWLGGETNFEPYVHIGDIVREFEQEKRAHYGPENIAEIYEDDRKLTILQKEKNIDLFTGYFVIDAKTTDQIIDSVELYNVRTGAHGQLKAPLFADCTGDGTLGFAAGADYETTTNGHMGMTNFWSIKDTGTPQPFPRCPWAIDLSKVEFPGRKDVKSVYGRTGPNTLGCWYWESGMEHPPIEKAEYARDTNFRAMYGAFDCIKNVDGDYQNYKIDFCAYIGGKRESRRLLGDIVLTKSDVSNGTWFADSFVPSTWNFDVHYPDRRFYAAFYEGDGFLTKDYHENFNRPYFIPYRCLYSRNIKNLFMAGRDISVSHDALGTARVMRTGGMMGEVVGMAAAICKAHHARPRDVYETYLSELIQKAKGE